MTTVLSAFQFMCVSISNITVAIFQKRDQAISVTLNCLSFDGSILPRSQIAVCVVANGFSCKLFETAEG